MFFHPEISIFQNISQRVHPLTSSIRFHCETKVRTCIGTIDSMMHWNAPRALRYSIRYSYCLELELISYLRLLKLIRLQYIIVSNGIVDWTRHTPGEGRLLFPWSTIVSIIMLFITYYCTNITRNDDFIRRMGVLKFRVFSYSKPSAWMDSEGFVIVIHRGYHVFMFTIVTGRVMLIRSQVRLEPDVD